MFFSEKKKSSISALILNFYYILAPFYDIHIKNLFCIQHQALYMQMVNAIKIYILRYINCRTFFLFSVCVRDNLGKTLKSHIYMPFLGEVKEILLDYILYSRMSAPKLYL